MTRPGRILSAASFCEGPERSGLHQPPLCAAALGVRGAFAVVGLFDLSTGLGHFWILCGIGMRQREEEL